MSGNAVFSLKAPSLLAFDKQRQEEEHNLRSIFHIRRIPCDTQMRTVLDGVNPEQLRRSYKAVFSRLQRGKALEEMEYLNGYYLMLLDGTEYFSPEKLHSPFCMERINSETGKTSYYLQTLGVALAHPDRKEVIPLMPEPISKQEGQTKKDCELNASRRFISKFRKEHPHLKVIVCQDAISPNGPYIRFLKEHNCRFILSVKESDHAYLFKVTLMMLAFLVDQTQQLSCTLFQSVWKKLGSKKALWERIRALFNCFLFDSMEMLYLAILHGYQKDRPRILWDDS